MTRWQRGARALVLTMAGAVALVCSGATPGAAAEEGRLVLESFTQADQDGFPVNWEHESARSGASARTAYTIKSEKGTSYLSVVGADQRIKNKQIRWDPKAYPVLSWRWRLHKAPALAEPIAVVYVSLDTDLLFIPVFTKYVWSQTRAEGSVQEGGMFSGTEIVVQSGVAPVGEWVEERVNVYEDFVRLHRHEPAAQAWGISLMGGPGVEIDFGAMTASPPSPPTP